MRAAGGRRGERLAQRPHELEVGPPRQPGDGERVELVAVLRNEPRLDAIRRPGERHQPAPPPQRLRDRECRRDVSHRPAGRDQEPQLPLVRHSRAMLRRTPTPTSITTRLEPPYETNGSGIPVSGARPSAAAMLIAA